MAWAILLPKDWSNYNVGWELGFRRYKFVDEVVSMGEGIVLAVFGAWVIGYCEIEPGVEDGPSGLTGVNSFGILGVLQVLVVCYLPLQRNVSIPPAPL